MRQDSTPAGELHGIQMLRAAAALAVLGHHALEVSNGAPRPFSPDWFTTSGAAGVDIFFVISGFIMLHTSFRSGRPPLGPGTFLLRRAIRIYPLYWLCCAAMLAVMAAGFMRHNALSAGDIARSLLLLPGPRLILGVAWTLVYEVYFYAIFALTLRWRSPLATVAGCSVAIGLLQVAGQALPLGATRDFLTNPIPWEFAMGLWLALAWAGMGSAAGEQRWAITPAWMLPGAALVMLAAVLVPHGSTAGLPGWARVAGWGVPALIIVAASLALPKPRGRAGRLMLQLGDASYALYLGHGFVMDGYGLALRHAGFARLPQWLVVPAVVALAVVLALALHHMAERPLLARLRPLRAPARPAMPPRPGPLRQPRPEAALPLP